MFSGKDAADPSYPTQWALNPNAYQNVDSSTVDWAALAQQWIAMKEAAVIMSTTPTVTSKPDAEEGEAPMEVENPDTSSDSGPPGTEWNATTNSYMPPAWNQWGWGWGSGNAEPKLADPSIAMAPLIDGYPVPPDGTAPIPGYSTGPAPTFQHGYWTAPQPDHTNNRDSSRSRDGRSKSKNRDTKPPRPRIPRDKPSLIPPVIEPIMPPTPLPPTTLDAAKRRQLPAWIREGLEKMEREKQRAIEREQEKKAREEAEREKKRLEEEELERMKAAAGGQPIMPAKSKFESDSEGESSPEPPPPPDISRVTSPSPTVEKPTLVHKSKEEIMQEVMMAVRVSLTEILLEVTDAEISSVCHEEYARFAQAQASRLNAMKASKSKALASIASGLGLGAYESSSDDSDAGEETKDITDQQLQDIIRRRKSEWERTARQIDADNESDEKNTPDTPHRYRSSATPPPVDSDNAEKIPERRVSKDKRNYKSNDRPDGVRRLDSIPEEKFKRTAKKDLTPSPSKNNHKKESSSSTSDSESDSSSDSSRSDSERDAKADSRQKKRKRKSSSSSDLPKKSKKHKKEKSRKSDDKVSSKSKYRDEYDKEKSRSKKRDEYERRKSSRSGDYEKSHKDKYRDDSEEERSRKRSRRSHSGSIDSRSERRRADRDRDRRDRDRDRERERDRDRERERERDRDYDSGRRSRSHSHSHSKHDRYERCRDYDRRGRERSRSRHRR